MYANVFNSEKQAAWEKLKLHTTESSGILSSTIFLKKSEAALARLQAGTEEGQMGRDWLTLPTLFLSQFKIKFQKPLLNACFPYKFHLPTGKNQLGECNSVLKKKTEKKELSCLSLPTFHQLWYNLCNTTEF